MAILAVSVAMVICGGIAALLMVTLDIGDWSEAGLVFAASGMLAFLFALIGGRHRP
jgi:hypothetical protein